MIKVAFVGSPSSGKTTLAKAVSADVASRRLLSEYVSEFARDYIVKYGPPGGIFEQLVIAQSQQQREDDVNPNAHYLFTDSPPFLTYPFDLAATRMNIPKEVTCLMHLYRDTLLSIHSYDFLFYMPRNPKPMADGVRSPEVLSGLAKLDTQIHAFLDLHRPDNYYTVPRGLKLVERVTFVTDVLEANAVDVQDVITPKLPDMAFGIVCRLCGGPASGVGLIATPACHCGAPRCDNKHCPGCASTSDPHPPAP